MFQEFWESFESAVDKDTKLDKIMKFTYLRSLLEDEAAAVISGLSLTSSNYDVALSLLRDRYANKQVLISSHIDQLLNLPTVNSSVDTVRLRNLYDQIKKNVRCLKTLDVSSVHYGPILLQIVMKKIPDDIQLIVSRSMASSSSTSEDTPGRSGDTWEIDELIKAFKREIESREMCNFIGSNPSAPNYTSSSLFAGAQNHPPQHTPSPKTPAQQCLYCDKKHATWKCNTVTDITSRKEILKKKGRCFVCLEAGHISRFCRNARVVTTLACASRSQKMRKPKVKVSRKLLVVIPVPLFLRTRPL